MFTSTVAAQGRHWSIARWARGSGVPAAGYFRFFLPPALAVGAHFLLFLSAAQAAPLNDTGIVFCIGGSCATVATDGGSYPRQDARFGRDAAAAAGQLPKVGGGGKGFDFSKIANNGSTLAASAALGTGATDWACTRDNVTGLTWEVKTATATDLRYLNHSYTWYDSVHHYYGTPGYAGTTSSCGNTLGGQNCNTQTYAAAVNAISLCGYADWRMPTKKELESIEDFGSTNPSIDSTYFPNTPRSSEAQYWSGSPYAGSPGGAWAIYFSTYGGSGSSPRTQSDNNKVRLVRGR